MINRAAIKQQAKAMLLQNYGYALGLILLFIVLLGALSAFSFGIAALVLTGPLTACLFWGLLNLYLGNPVRIGDAFNRGFENIGRKIGGYLWMMLFTWLWSLLFFIPGIIKTYSYSMTMYILADLPEIGAKDALRLSMRMMQGHKWELFVMQLSFLGWMILGLFTFNLLNILYTIPYMQLSSAGFYASVKQDAIDRGILVPAVVL